MATILIVDTNPTDRRSYITLLGNFGYRLLEAKDGAEAVELARTELPDLIITDILMPNMDGFTLVRRLRAEPLLAGVPVIFQTAHYLESEIHKLATANGIEHILGKPTEPQEILRAVQDSLQHPAKRSKLPQTGQLHREHLQLLADKLYQKNIELEKANERLRNLSLTDELTGLNNRRGFAILANGLFKFARRAGHQHVHVPGAEPRAGGDVGQRLSHAVRPGVRARRPIVGARTRSERRRRAESHRAFRSREPSQV